MEDRGGRRDRRFAMFGLLQAVENYRSPFESLRANGGAVEMIEYFPFVLSFVEALLSFSTACQG